MLNEEMLGQTMKEFARQELAQIQVAVSAQVTSDQSGNVSVSTVQGPLTMDERILSALANGFARAVVTHFRAMGQADPNTGKIF